MLGRKAIHHTSKLVKRKWQLEQEKIDDKKDVSSDSESEDGDGSEQQPLSGGPGGGGDAAAEPARKAPRKSSHDAQEGETEVSKGGGGEGSGSENGDAGDAGKQKRFAWMDSGDEASDGEEEESAAMVPKASKTGAGEQQPVQGATPSESSPPAEGGSAGQGEQAAAEAEAEKTQPGPVATSSLPGTVTTPAWKSDNAAPGTRLAGNLLAQQGALRQPLRPPPVLPKGVVLPILTKAHLGLMARVGGARQLVDLWDIVEEMVEDFAPAHCALSLHRIAALVLSACVGVEVDLKLVKHRAFERLLDRLDELLATAKGRSEFIPADFAMVACALAKVVNTPAREGCVGRIFAELVDEAEMRISAEPLSFTVPMLADLAWGITKTGNHTEPLLRNIIKAAEPMLNEATCQDLANFAAALADQTLEEADSLLRAVLEHATMRMGHASGTMVSDLPVSSRDAPADDVPERSRVQPMWQQIGQWRFSASQVSELVAAVSKHISLYDEVLFSLAAQSLMARLQELSVPQLQRVRDAFELCRHDGDVDFLRAMRSALKVREGKKLMPGQLPVRRPYHL